MKNLLLMIMITFFGSWSIDSYGQGNDCSSAQSLTVNVGSCVFSAASNTGLTNSGQVPVGADCDFYSGGDGWYSIVIPASGIVTVSTTLIPGTTPPALNINAAAYSGTCGSLTLIGCDANSGPGFFPELELTGTAGETVFIQLWETNNNVQGDYSICANGATTCTPPTVAFSESCIGGNEYEVDVFISSLGDATSLNITNDGGAASITNITSPGIQTVGPFPLGTSATINVVHNDDNTCNVSQLVTDVGLACDNVLTCGNTLDQSYCYQNNDNTSFLYSSPDGSPITLTFLSGELEDVLDQITIRDGSDGAGTILFQGSNGGDLTGVSETATSGSLSMTATSDVSGSCEDGSFNFELGWAWQVSCEGCTAPTVDFTVVDNCGAGTFTVDVDITSLGNSASVSISNDAGVTATTGVSATGVQNVGPFNIGSPVEITVSSESISGCELVQGGLDFTCPTGDNCLNASTVISQTTFADSEIGGDVSSVTYSLEPQCNGPGNNPDPYFSFTAVGSTSYFRVETSGDFDPAVEVFDGCDGTQLACVNEAGAGLRELFWVNDLTPGQEYVYRVYHAGGSAPATTSFTTGVAHIPFVRLRPADCGASELTANSLIRATLPNPNFLLDGFIFEFTELESPFETYEVESPNGTNPNFYIGWFENFEYGRSYDVRVRARMYQGPNLGDYGVSCTISMADGPTTFLLDNFADGFYNMCDFVKARRIFGATNYRWVFDDGSDQLEYNSGTTSPICPLQLVDGLELGTTYSVTVFATDAQGNESTISLAKEINMNNFVPNTEVNPMLFTCGVTVSLSQVLTAVEVCSAEQYTFRFDNVSQPGENPIEIVRPNRNVLLSFVTGLISGDTYNVTVKANSGGLQGDYSNGCEITVEGLSGLVVLPNTDYSMEQDDQLSIMIFPNPSDGSEIQISIETALEKDQISLEIYDLQGKKLISELIPNSSGIQRLNLNGLSKGIYLLQARAGNELITTEKLIVD
ncbi:T9SS type A sorting domain-containing protein [Cryomorphaceae bacterium 1068]|nr:T9SS type A sorting domain-containing protein [Cryomorphaceae bacterium 1068]